MRFGLVLAMDECCFFSAHGALTPNSFPWLLILAGASRDGASRNHRLMCMQVRCYGACILRQAAMCYGAMMCSAKSCKLGNGTCNCSVCIGCATGAGGVATPHALPPDLGVVAGGASALAVAVAGL